MTTTEQTDTFPVQWDDPADAAQTWHFSDEHMPHAVAPLEFELGLNDFLVGFGWGMQPRQINYYVFFTMGAPASAPPPATTPDAVREAARRWNEDLLPEVLRNIEYFRTTDFDAMSNEQLIAEVERLKELRFRSGQIHTMAISPHWQGMGLLIQTFKELTGGDDLGAMRLVQGYPNKSVESSERLWQVSRVANNIPSVRDRILAIESAAAHEMFAALRDDADAAPFVEAFDAYLEEYGWRSNAGFGSPTWYEDPAVPLALLRAYLQTEGYDPAAEHHRLLDERDAFERETLASLPDDAARDRLRDAIDAARAVAPQLEDHNFFIDQRFQTMPRRLVLAAGRRAGLAKPNDVFYLDTAQLFAALRGEARDLDPLAQQRKAELEKWRAVKPPLYVGVAPPQGAPQQARPAPAEAADGLRGTGVSAGVARGPARIIAGLGEADRLRPGDILVTSVTQPAWTPLFAVARGVVTEVGGMLSHTAVASREFGLPAVVNVRDAMRSIRDGQLVEVDGAAGTIRIVG